MLPAEVLFKIAQFVDPLPELYISLATTSKLFFSVFMSDVVWRNVDIYNVQSQISSHFLLSILSDPQYKREYKQYVKRDKRLVSDTLLDNWQKSSYLYLLYSGIFHVGFRDSFMLEHREILLFLWRNRGNFFPNALSHVSNNFRGDREVALAAVQLNGMNLKFFSWELQGDDEIIFLAIDNDPDAVQYINDNKLTDRAFVLRLVRGYAVPFRIIPRQLQCDNEIIAAGLARLRGGEA